MRGNLYGGYRAALLDLEEHVNDQGPGPTSSEGGEVRVSGHPVLRYAEHHRVAVNFVDTGGNGVFTC